MRYYVLALLVTVIGIAFTVSVAASQTVPAAVATVSPATAVPSVAPTVTPVVIEVRQPLEAPKSFLERYGVVALLISGIIGGLLTLVFRELLGPTFAEWGKRFNEWRKGAAGRFREKYVPALAEAHRDLKLVGVHGREQLPRPRLKEVYVTLRVGSAGQTKEHLGPAMTIGQALSEHSRLLILGEPGAGKSTLLDYLTLIFCGEIQAAQLARLGDLLPVYLPLHRCVADDRPLHDLLADSDFLPLDIQPPDGFFEQQLDDGHCLVLLDGLDEVVDENERKRAADKINQLVRTFPDSLYVVTCRTAGWRESLLTGEFTPLDVRKFDDADIARFVTGWYRAIRTQQVRLRVLSDAGRQRAMDEAQRRAKREAQALLKALRRNLSLYRLASNPLILSLIALVHYRRRDLPRGRAKLYQECLEILLDVWDAEDKELNIEGPSLYAKETILREIAYYLHANGITEGGREELEQLIEPLIPNLDCPTNAEETLHQIEERSGILVTRGIDRYVFAHRTLQEYLTARVLADSREGLALLINHLRDEPWREVILLYVGLVSDATELIRLMLAQNDDAALNMLILAGQCLAEDVHVDEEVRSDVLAQLETAFRQPGAARSPVRFRRLGETLATIGGKDVLEFFADVLAEGQPPQRVVAANVLGDVGKTTDRVEAAHYLIAHMTPAGDAEVIRAVCLALAELGVDHEQVLDNLERVREKGAEAMRGPALWALLELGQAERFGMVKVPAGEFLMGSDPEKDQYAYDNEQPQHTLYLPDYYIAITPVTNAQFSEFVKKTDHRTQDDRQAYAVPDRRDHPVVHVSWHDALAYAHWLGAELPSEAEWEKAARGTNGRIWPWGNEWGAARCNSAESDGSRLRARLETLLRRWSGRDRVGTTPVGRYSPAGDSPYGCVDMAGNVWEWTRSLWGESWDEPSFRYPYDPMDGREDLEASGPRVLRGGSFFNRQGYVRCASRYRNYPDYGDRNYGFRVVVSPFTSEL